MWFNSSAMYSKPFTDYKNCLFWRNKDNRSETLFLAEYYRNHYMIISEFFACLIRLTSSCFLGNYHMKTSQIACNTYNQLKRKESFL